jgi:potassium-transporting ATPase KdpC subunit
MRSFKTALKIFLLLTIITGIGYPLLITGMVNILYPSEANGSIIHRDGKAVGSELIGQRFDTSIYFSSRPSTIGYNPLPSGGSNYGPTNAKLKQQVEDRHQIFITMNHLKSSTIIPSEMLFASGSGLDPHISVRAAQLQIQRIAEARHFNAAQTKVLEDLVWEHTESPQFKILGKGRINVLLLNLDLDRIK